MTINSASNVYNLYSALYQNSMSMFNNKLSKTIPFSNSASNTSDFSAGALQYVNSLKSASKDISSALSELKNGGAFNKKSMVSSDSDVLSVKYSGNKFSNEKSVSVKVEQLASGQVNEGDKLKSSAAFGNTGKNTFAVEIDGKTTNFSVSAAYGDTNKDVQQKMADEINKAGIGVKASVVTENDMSYLKLEAAGTGDDAKNKFSIKDLNGNAVAKTGANRVSQNAQDAIYSVDGGETRTSKSNTVELSANMSVTFKGVSDKAVDINMGVDKDYAKSMVKDLVSSFNELFDAAASNASSDKKASNLLTKLQSISKTYSSSLSEIGVNVNKDGSLSIDSAKLGEASESGKLEKFFTENRGSNYGFTNQLEKLAGNVSGNTSNYVSKSSVGSSLTESFSYSSIGSLLSDNSQSSGWLLDYLF